MSSKLIRVGDLIEVTYSDCTSTGIVLDVHKSNCGTGLWVLYLEVFCSEELLMCNKPVNHFIPNADSSRALDRAIDGFSDITKVLKRLEHVDVEL